MVATYCIPVCCYSLAVLDHILHISVLLQHDSTRPHTACKRVVTVATYCIPVSCYSVTALGLILHKLCYYSGHILHTSVSFQWPHTAYQCVVSVATYCIPVCCYIGHILHTNVLLDLGISLTHLRMFLVGSLLKKSRMCFSNG